ncbi:MAG: tetratricopeptide repeat protein, partial [Myxococcota bacterium]|nr:tetratricopeptide repeat protein [Myxococcota bacterium]
MLRCIRSLSRDPRSAAQAHRMRPRQTPTRASLRSLLVDWALGLFSQLVYLRVLRRRVGARLLLSASLAATLCVACITRSSVAEDPPPPVDAPSTDVASVLAPFFSNGPLSAARQDFDRGRWQQAADAFSALDDDARKSLSTEELQAFQLMHGFALLRAGHSDSAKTILAALASENTLYTDYANALAARAALELGDFAEAMRLAAAVSNDAAISSWARCTFSIADLRVALSPPQKTVIPNAIDRLLLLLPELDREHSRMARLAIAQAQETLEQKLEAATLYQKLIDEAPNSSEGKSASTAIELLLPQLDEKDRARFAPPPASPFDDAMAHYNAHRSEKAIEAFLALRKKLDKKTTVEDWCRASFHIAKSHTKLREHSKAKGYYQETIDNCADNEWQLKALYNGGLAYWNANEKKDAIAVFERLIKDYPSSNLADDAYFFIARIQLEEEKTQAAHDSLEAQLAAYPAGDMAKDARWLLFSHLYAAGQFDEAIAYVDTHAESTDEDDVSSRGRLAYFRARALEQSKRLDQAQSAYAGIVEAHPGDYFAALAFARLSAIGADKASELSTRLRPAPADLSQRLAQLQAPTRLANASYQRAIAFSRMGRYEWVEAEAKRAGDELGEQDSI